VARKKVLICRIMPYSTMLNRARMFRALGWEPYLIHEQPFANPKLLRDCARTFEEIWSQDYVVEDANSIHDFVRKKGFDLIYTIGPPDRFNVHFTNIACPWIHDSRDLGMLTNPQANDPERLEKARQIVGEWNGDSSTCINACDVAVFVTPWQQEKALSRLYPQGDAKPAAWLPNVPFNVPQIEYRKSGAPVCWGYTGNMKAAWQNAPTHLGHVVGELDRLDVDHEFHMWSFMEMPDQQASEYLRLHDTQAQEDMIVSLAETLDYGILFPPTESDGINGKTGWPGKIGDYIAAGITALVPHDFMIRHTLSRNGWGIAYETLKDAARIIASGRKPKNPRKPAPYLAMPDFMSTLEIAVGVATRAFEKRYVDLAPVPVKETPLNVLVASDKNAYHAKNHIAPILSAEAVSVGAEVNGHKDLYMLGMWAVTPEEGARYNGFLDKFERAVVQWAGTDLLMARENRLEPWFKEIVGRPNIVHIAPDSQMAGEVKRELGLPCRIVHAPSRFMYERPFPLPKQFAVSVYYPSFNREIYSLDLVDEVMARMKDTLFYVHRPSDDGEKPVLPKNAMWLGNIPEPNYAEFLKQISVLLRLTVHDGTPYGMIEHFCAGRNVVMPHDYPFVTRVPFDAVEVVKAVNLLKRERKPNLAAAEYWRAYNDFGRFRANVREVLEDAGKGTPETAVAGAPVGADG